MKVIQIKNGFEFNYFIVKETLAHGYILEDDSYVQAEDVFKIYDVLGYIKCINVDGKSSGFLPSDYLSEGKIYPVFDSYDSNYGTEYSFIANGNIRRYMSFADNSPFIGKFEWVKL